MQTTISTELLMKLLRANPEQLAIVEQVVSGNWQGAIGTLINLARAAGEGSGGGEQVSLEGVPEADGRTMERHVRPLMEKLNRIEHKIDGLQSLAELKGRSGTERPVTESEAARVFVLMQRLENGRKQRKAPLITVFRITVLEGHSQVKTAKMCGCVPALISRRVKTIESRFGMSIERLRNCASALLEMEASVKGDRTRKKKRGDLRDESAQYDEGPGRPEWGEDEHGYLPEERQESED